MKKILIAEDDKFLASAYKIKMEKFGYEVRLCSTGEETIRQLSSFTPDLIILDILMPGKDGYGVLEDLKKNTKWHSIPVIISTNLDQTGDLAKCRTYGVADYIVKNRLSFEKLHEKIKTILHE